MRKGNRFEVRPVYRIVGVRSDQSVTRMTIDSDESLVMAAKNGEHWAYAELCGRHREMLLRTLQLITGKIEDSEDVLQDSFIKAFTHIQSFDGRSAFSTWLTRIAINSALMMLRKRRRRPEILFDDHGKSEVDRLLEVVEPSQGPEEQCIRSETQLRVRKAIQNLPPRLREVTEIHQSTEGSVEEVATMAGLSVSATKSRLFRARLALRKRLKRAYTERNSIRADAVEERKRM